jgi:uncharacterized protein
MKISILIVASFSFLVILFVGCSATVDRSIMFKDVDSNVKNGSYQQAITNLHSKERSLYGSKDSVLYYLDLGMITSHSPQNMDSNSNLYLSLAEKHIEEEYTRSLSSYAVSMLANDNALTYAGENYENIYLNIFKALNYIDLKLYDDAFVEIRRINDKLNQLSDKYATEEKELNKLKNKNSNQEDRNVQEKPSADDNQGNGRTVSAKPSANESTENEGIVSRKPETEDHGLSNHKESVLGKSRFHNSCLGRYLSMLLYRAENKFDDARIDCDKIKEGWASQSNIYNFPMPLLDYTNDTSSNTKINVLSFIGGAPQKHQDMYSIKTFSNTLTVFHQEGTESIKSLVYPWPGIKAGLSFKFAIPFMDNPTTKVDRIEVDIDSVNAGELHLIEKLGAIAVETFNERKPLIELKAVTRTVLKGLANEELNQELDKKTGGGYTGQLTRLFSGALVDLTESADTRCARYIPSYALVGEFTTKPGLHNVALKYYSRSGKLLFTDNFNQNVASKDGLNLLHSVYLD